MQEKTPRLHLCARRVVPSDSDGNGGGWPVHDDVVPRGAEA